MVAVPLTDPRILTLSCEDCQRVIGPLAVSQDCWHILWDVARDLGWTGADALDGPHRCLACGPPAGAGTTPHHKNHRNESLVLPAHVYADGTTIVVRFFGDLDVSQADDLRGLLRHALPTAGPHLILDMGAVRHIDPTVLGVLVRVHQRLRGTTGLCLASPAPFVRTVLHTMRLDGLFRLFDRVEDAVNGLAGQASA